MLKAFTARPVVELKQRDKSKIETILAYGMRFIGASQLIDCSNAVYQVIGYLSA